MRIEDFSDMNILITWTLIRICFDSNRLLRNSEYEETSISANDVIEYAVGLLERNENEAVVSLAILRCDEKEDILNSLIKLSEAENADYRLEFRKFRAMYICENLPSRSDDYMHGIIKISELWDKFGFPDDSPNMYLEFKNFSQENYNILLDIHNSWLKSEFEHIRYEIQ